MKAEEFAKGLKREIVETNIEIYRDLFNNSDVAHTQDKYWSKALTFYHKLNECDKKVFFQILNQVSVDTISSILAIIDGVTLLEKQDGEFKLLIGENEINGDLQDTFLELYETDF